MKEKNKIICELLLRLHGIDVSKFDVLFLNKSFQKRITETHCESTEEYYNLLENNPKEGKTFIETLHISYSEFFRNPLTFSVLERIILPSLVLKKKNTKLKELRIWSAACAGGQEAYSLAILMEELKNGNNEKIKYRIFATDQSESQLTEARNGQYNPSALDNVNMKRTRQWFNKQGEIYSVKPELKENIDFSVFDLFSKQFSSPPVSIFGDFDLIVCANLLFYYKPEFREVILEKTGKCIAKGGYLITGETEREIFMNYNYHEVYPHSAIFKI